jgi:hypothetical protein
MNFTEFMWFIVRWMVVMTALAATNKWLFHIPGFHRW